jgi:WXXGXW repeat (2 copies)
MTLKFLYRMVLGALLLGVLPATSMAQISVGVSVNVAPPELPVYDQPPIPGDGYIWTPGYWAWSDDIQDYYWVPGTWVEAPQPEYLWTPGYWGWQGGAYLWNAGYWGPHVGFYGGVNYGFGYGGSGFEGGYWQGGHMYYNRSVTNISTTNVTNVYNKTVINNVTVNQVSYNGGTGGIRAQPTAAEMSASREQHIAAVPAQRQQEQTAHSNPALRAGNNHGKPPIAATARAGAFSGAGVVAARKGGAVSAAHPGATHPAQTENRPAQPERRAVQPENRPAPAMRADPAVTRPAPQAPHEAPPPREPAPQREAPREAPPRPAPAAVPRPSEPRPESRPAERTPPREESHDKPHEESRDRG